MLKFKHVATAIFFTAAMAAHGMALAGQWRVNSAQDEEPGSSSALGKVVFNASGATFVDGKTLPHPSPIVDVHTLAAASWDPSGVAGLGLTFSYDGEIWTPTSLSWAPEVVGQAQAPQVDLPNMRADFSALWVTIFLKNGGTPGPLRNPGVPADAYVPGGGWNVGAPGWVPLTANGDGSYTAAWITPAPTDEWVGGGHKFLVNFSPVPEADLSAMVLAGLGVLSLRLMRRKA